MVRKAISIFILVILLSAMSLNAISIYSFTLKSVSDNAKIDIIQILMILYGFGLFIFYAYIVKRNIKKDNINIILLSVIVFLALITRITWLLVFKTKPVSDYYMYNELAKLLAQGYSFKDLYALGSDHLSYAPGFPHVSFFALILSAVYKITGISDYSIGQYFNILMTVYTAVMIYLLGKKYVSLWLGFFASALFIFTPAYIMFSTLLGTEPLFLALLTTGLYFINFPLNEVKIKTTAATGIILALANSVRPVAVIFIIAAVLLAIYFMTFSFSKDSIRKYLKYSGCLIISFILFSSVIYHAMALLVHFPIAGSAGGYSLYIGSNIEAKGQWNEKDMLLFKDRLQQNINDPQSVHNSMQKDAAVRYLQIIKDKKLLSFLYNKIEIFNDERYGVIWNIDSQIENIVPLEKSNKQRLIDISVNYYFVLVLLSIGGCIQLWINKRHFLNLLGLSFVGLVLSFLLVEVQGRYHIVLMPIYVLFAAYPLYKLFEALPQSYPNHVPPVASKAVAYRNKDLQNIKK